MDNGAGSYRRFLAGDDEGLAEIVREYKDGLILYLNGYVCNLYIAEELAEDTFFRLITKRPRFSQKSSFKSWLYAIGRNVAVDFVRRNSKQISVSAEGMEVLGKELSLEEAYIREESKAEVYKALSKLSVDYRNVLWLSFFEGFSNREVAKVMKKSDRQVKNLLYRAKQSLRSILEKEGFHYEK